MGALGLLLKQSFSFSGLKVASLGPAKFAKYTGLKPDLVAKHWNKIVTAIGNENFNNPMVGIHAKGLIDTYENLNKFKQNIGTAAKIGAGTTLIGGGILAANS
jgi:hypothetical protein